MRRAHRVDECQAEIVDALRRMGAFVLDLSALGQEGVPDLFVCFRGYRPAGGCKDHLAVWSWTGFLECKSPDGKLTAGQRRFIALCPLPVRVVRSIDDALEAMMEVA